MEPLERGAAIHVSLESRVKLQQWYAVKIRRERTDLRDLLRRPKQKIFILMIQASQCPNDIAGVRTDAKFGHPADVDGDLHGKI